VDDVFNSVPFLTKRKEAIEKEMASIEETMAALAEQYSELEGEWGDKVLTVAT
jgi:prefoldin subunit 5